MRDVEMGVMRGAMLRYRCLDGVEVSVDSSDSSSFTRHLLPLQQ